MRKPWTEAYSLGLVTERTVTRRAWPSWIWAGVIGWMLGALTVLVSLAAMVP